jgi:hypothetical protein
MERRNLVNGGLVAGLTALVASSAPDAAAAAAAGGGQDGGGERVASAVGELRQSLEQQLRSQAQGPWTGVAAIRRQQREWLKATDKYPDFIEVGIGIWESLYDWHVRFQQPISMTRLADGRYAMAFMFTTLLLRPDMAAEFVGYPFEAEGRRAPAASPQ